MYLSPERVLFIREHRNDDIRSLALQAKKYPQVDMSSAIVQIAGWQAAASKIPSWHATENLLYPRHLSLEQCSSEITALYKASLAQGETLVDLTGGFGLIVLFSQPGLKQSPTSNAKKNFARLPLTIFHYWD